MSGDVAQGERQHRLGVQTVVDAIRARVDHVVRQGGFRHLLRFPSPEFSPSELQGHQQGQMKQVGIGGLAADQQAKRLRLLSIGNANLISASQSAGVRGSERVRVRFRFIPSLPTQHVTWNMAMTLPSALFQAFTASGVGSAWTEQL